MSKPRPQLNQRNVFARMGGDVFAPLLGSFAWWLHRQAVRDGVTQLLFLARDGYMLQRAYQQVIPEKEQIPSRYMYASRRLFNLAAIRVMDEPALKFLMGDGAVMPVRQYLQRAGLEPEKYTAEALQAGFGSGLEAVVTKADEGRLKTLFLALRKPILAVSEAERRRLKAYADSLTDWDIEECAVVDVGWHASLQASLNSVLGLPPGSLRGYYLGLHLGVTMGQANMRRAYLDESRPQDFWAYHNSLRRCVEVFELSMAETEGSVIGLRETAAGFAAVRENYRPPAEMQANIERAQGAMIEALRTSDAPTERKVVLRRLGRLLSHPKADEAAALGDLTHQEGFGGQGRLEQVARPRYDLREYLQRPGELIWDLRKTFWRNGFLARLLRRN